jgi:PGF-pre-PGF domain-containing protein
MNKYTKISIILLLIVVSIVAIYLEPVNITGAASTHSDTTPPAITNIAYTQNLNQGQNQTISATITDNINLSVVFFEINSDNTLITSNTSTYLHTYQPPAGTNQVIIHAKDTSDNENSTLISFTVNDTQSPSITSSYTTNVVLGNNQTISATITDNTNISTALIEINNTNITLTSTSDTYTYSYQPNDLGIHEFTIHASDTTNNKNSTTYSFTVTEYVSSNSSIENSVITADSKIIDSTVRNSIINSSTIVNSLIEDMTVTAANIIDDTLYIGTIIYQGTTYTKANLPLSTIYNGDSYCGDSTCNSDEACYTCTEDCNSCDYQTTIIDNLESSNTLTQLFTSIPADREIELLADDSVLPVTKIQIHITDSIAAAKLEIVKDNTDSDSTIYRYFQINHENLSSSNINNIRIFFRVHRDWIYNNGLAYNAVKLQKEDSEWEDITTEYQSEDGNYYNYKAYMDSFSNFRIIASETPSECGNGIVEAGETQNTCCIDTGCDSGFVCRDNTCIENLCGNGICDPDESPETCLQDCPTICGNGICEFNEDNNICPDDCPAYFKETPAPEVLESEEVNTTPAGFAVAKNLDSESDSILKSATFKYSALGAIFVAIAILFALMQLGYLNLPITQQPKPQRPQPQPTQAQRPQQPIQPQKVPRELDQYINTCIRARMHPAQIKQLLINSGWQPELIDYVLRTKRYI